MLLNELRTRRFSPAGKGGYKAGEVDEFLDALYKEYSSFISNYKTLKDRLDICKKAIEEYDEQKASIATALITAQTTAEKQMNEARVFADELIKKATAEADELLSLKQTEADAYYFDRTHDAIEQVKALEAKIEDLQKRYAELSEEYIGEATRKAAEIIAEAKRQAAEIIAEANAKAAEIESASEKKLGETAAQLTNVKAAFDSFKKQLHQAVDSAMPQFDEITFDAEVDVSEINDKYEEKEDTFEMPEFSFDFAVAAPVQEETAEESTEETTEEAQEESQAEESQDISSYSAANGKPVIPDAGDYVSKIFDDEDIAPSDFSYRNDYDDIASDVIFSEDDDTDGEESDD